jgi:hypothetical protein
MIQQEIQQVEKQVQKEVPQIWALLHNLADKAHHYAYALAGVAIVALVVFFAPKHEKVAAPVATAPSIASEVGAFLAAQNALAASHGPVAAYERPAVTVLDSGGAFSAAATAQILHALGNAPTATVAHVAVVGPTPGPSAAPPLSVDPAYAAWHHADTYNATAEAIAKTKVAVTLTQEPAPPSRVKVLYLSDSSAGVAYALRRRGQWDLDAGITQNGPKVQPALGVTWRLKGTSAGIFAGATVRAGSVNPAAGFSLSF